MSRRTTRPRLARRLIAAGAFALAAGAALAQGAAPPAYTATALHQLPDGTTTSGTVTKSGANMRLEYDQGGTRVIQIIRRAEGVMLMLDPARQAYTEVRGQPAADPTGAGYLPPCPEGDPTLNCTFIGNEVTSGITAEVWEIAPPGQAGTSRILWDGARHRALSQVSPDGSTMTMSFKAMEEIAGRQAEHWEIAYEAPGQAPARGDWFYDPELRVEIREVTPTGEIRWLEDIAVGPVDETLFAAPSGWTRVELPAAPTAPQIPN